MLDFHGKGAEFKRDVMADAEDLVRRMIGGLSATFAAQKDGVVVSDQHRVLNFLGAGVAVADEPLSRRTNITITGSLSSPRVTVLASTVGQGFVLISASTPANDGGGLTWRQVGYAHSGWIATLAETFAYPGFAQIPGTVFVCPLDGTVSGTQVFYLHHEFTLTAGQLASGILDIVCDGSGDAYINDTFVATLPTGAAAYSSIAIPAGLLVTGTNVLAIKVNNQVGGGANPSSTEYRITVTDAGSSTLSANLASNSAAFTTLTTVMSLTLTQGTWFVWAHASLISSTGAANVAMQLTDGTTVYGSGNATTGTTNFQQNISVTSEPITVASGTKVVNMQCVSQSSTVAQATGSAPGALTKATHMRALRVG